jgi:hypothetical protein
MNTNGLLDPEPVDTAVEMSLISCLQVEIYAFEVKKLPSWTFPFPVWSHGILLSPGEKLDPGYVGILLLSSPKAEIYAFEVHRRPS